MFGGYLVLGAHFTTNVKQNISIEWFDNIGTLQNDLVTRSDTIDWTKLNHPRLKWFGYSQYGDQLSYDKLKRSEIYKALQMRFPHKPDYRFEQGYIANIQISSTGKSTVMEMGGGGGGGRRRTKRNAIRNKQTSTKTPMHIRKSTRRRK